MDSFADGLLEKTGLITSGAFLSSLCEGVKEFNAGVGFEPYDVDYSADFSSWEVIGQKKGRLIPYSSVTPPKNKIRVINDKGGETIAECYEPYYEPLKTYDLSIIASLANRQPTHWKITARVMPSRESFCDCTHAKLIHKDGHGLFHEECGRSKGSKVEDWSDHVNSLHIGMPDDNYNGHYPTLPGDDIAHYNPNGKGMDAFRGGETLYGDVRLDNQNKVIEGRQPIRGGKEIRGGRSEYREASKDLILWDNGTQKDLDRHKKEAKEKRAKILKEQVAIAVNKGPSKKPFSI